MIRKLVLGLMLGMTTVTVALPARAASSNTMNFRFNPIGLLVGVLGVNLDFQVADEWTVGPELGYINYKRDPGGVLTEEIKVKGYGFGLRANWFSNGVYTDGLYLGPSLSYASVKASSRDSFGEITGEADGATLGFLIGYGWFWDSFNMMLGGGLTIPLGDSEVTVTDSSGQNQEVTPSEGHFALEFTLGWTF